MIVLYGNLRELYGSEINAKVASVKELMQAAEANRPGFRSSIDKCRKYVIKRGSDLCTAKVVDEAEVEMKFSEDTWHVFPMPVGFSGVARAIVGVVLIVVGAVINVWSGGSLSWLGTPMMKIGAGLLISGVVSMLAPSPNISNYGDRESPDARPSALFDGPTNKAAAGGSVPLIFGFNVDVGSTFVSGGIEVGDMV